MRQFLLILINLAILAVALATGAVFLVVLAGILICAVIYFYLYTRITASRAGRNVMVHGDAEDGNAHAAAQRHRRRIRGNPA